MVSFLVNSTPLRLYVVGGGSWVTLTPQNRCSFLSDSCYTYPTPVIRTRLLLYVPDSSYTCPTPLIRTKLFCGKIRGVGYV